MANSHAASPIKPVGITLGDAAGIGPEIITRLLAEGPHWPVVVYADPGVLDRAIRALGLNTTLSINSYAGIDDIAWPLPKGTVAVVNRHAALPDTLQPGVLNAHAGRAAYEYVCHATDDALAGKLRAVVTAPLNKAAMQLAGIDYPGHTEILADRTGTAHFAMMLANQELRVILVTIHIPLASVSHSLTIDKELQTIRLAHMACRHAGIATPRVAIAGLNPHAGEHGKFGHEESNIIEPAIALARAEGINVSGPWPGDTIFMRARKGEFDIVVAQYHDQGLIPVKYLGVDEGVNVTVGLPFIRTSVDHGTAFDIAGKGIADAGSLKAAFNMALAMSGSVPG
ncbi:MAG: 4-hydroxythreonine-4-phosphate dehydrogenase PdxA [Pusillimonas sp.]